MAEPKPGEKRSQYAVIKRRDGTTTVVDKFSGKPKSSKKTVVVGVKTSKSGSITKQVNIGKDLTEDQRREVSKLASQSSGRLTSRVDDVSVTFTGRESTTSSSQSPGDSRVTPSPLPTNQARQGRILSEPFTPGQSARSVQQEDPNFVGPRISSQQSVTAQENFDKEQEYLNMKVYEKTFTKREPLLARREEIRNEQSSAFARGDVGDIISTTAEYLGNVALTTGISSVGGAQFLTEEVIIPGINRLKDSSGGGPFGRAIKRDIGLIEQTINEPRVVAAVAGSTAVSFVKGVKNEFVTDPEAFILSPLAEGQLLTSAGKTIGALRSSSKGISFQAKLDKALGRDFVVTELPAGYNPAKGEFRQFLSDFQGQTITTTGGGQFGVIRSKTPFNVVPGSGESFRQGYYTFLGFKPGQIVRQNPAGFRTVLRNVPSEFATPAAELAIAGSKQTIASTVSDDSFLRGGSYTVLLGGGQELSGLSGRALVGGGELGQFFAPKTIKPITTATGDVIPAGTPQAYLFYGGKDLDYRDLLTGAGKLTSGKPAVIIETGVPVRDVNNPRTRYEQLAQELSGFTEPGTIQASASTLAGVRAESEVIKSVGSQTSLRRAPSVRVAGEEFRLYGGRTKPFESLTPSEYVNALESTKFQLEERVIQANILAVENPALAKRAAELSSREAVNIRNIERAISETRRTGRKTPVSGFVGSSDDVLSSSSLSRSSSSSLSSGSVRVSSAVFDVSSSLSRSVGRRLGSSRSSSSGSSSGSLPSFIVSSPSVSSSLSSGASGASGVSSVSRGFSGSSGVSSVSRGFSGASGVSSVSRGVSGLSGSSSISKGLSYSTVPFKENIFSPRRKDSFIGGLFSVFVRRGGEFQKVGTTKSKRRAFGLGSQVVGTSAAASFKVTSESGGVVTPTNVGKDFYASTKEAGVIIERRERRIKSGGELREITFKGVQAQKNKRRMV